MPTKRLSMRKIREIMRLKWEMKLPHRSIATSVGTSASTVAEVLSRAERAGVSWPLPAVLDDRELEQRLYPPCAPSNQPRPAPDLEAVHRELRRKHVTLALLWEEYRATYPDGYAYSRFCELYAAWAKRIDVSMRQEHKAGEKVFVDFAGQTVPVVDAQTGEVVAGQLFVGVLGASSYAYAELVPSQDIRCWIGAHVRMFAFFEGVPEIVVPDNLKAGVRSPCRYEPDINRTYLEMAQHYGIAVIPARVRKPRDKAKAELGVLIAERRILAPLRNVTFLGFAEANKAIRAQLEQVNARRFKRMNTCRRELFERVDRPALRPLPQLPFEMGIWSRATVNIDYHIVVDGHFYSVPFTLRGHKVEARSNAATVEIFEQGRRVATHPRSFQKGRYTTVREHMPKAHQAYTEWTPSRLIQWAAKSGPSTSALVEELLRSKPHPEQGYRACLGVMRLGTRFGAERLEAACARAVALRAAGYKSVANILKAGLDRQPLPGTLNESRPPEHDNVRGPDYYDQDRGKAASSIDPKPSAAAQ